MIVNEILGWLLVGILLSACCVLALQLGWVLVEMWRDFHEVDDEELLD